jgi:hypothetical protein
MENKEAPEENETHADKYKGEALNAYRAFDETLKVNEGDNFAIKILKVLGRVFGITFFILISPFVMIGLFFALIAAG